MIVFLVGSIWHGANWTFIVWGVLHGIAQVLTRILERTTGLYSKNSKMINAVSWIITFIFINLTWVIFRANSLAQAAEFFTQFGNFTGLAPNFDLIAYFASPLKVIVPLALFVFAMVASVWMKNTNQRLSVFKPTYAKAIVTSGIVFWCIMSFAGVSSFLYWNF